MRPARQRDMWDDRIQRYKLKGRELAEDDGAYIHWLHMRFSQRRGPRNDCKGYQVRVSALGNGYSKWFGVTAWGSKAEAYKAAVLYREFALSRLPNLFPTKEQFVMWMVKRAEHPAVPAPAKRRSRWRPATFQSHAAQYAR